MAECPICESVVVAPVVDTSFSGFNCPRCGRWSLDIGSESVSAIIAEAAGEWDVKGVHRRSVLSHKLRTNQPTSRSRWAQLFARDWKNWHLDEDLPTPAEQVDRLISLAGSSQLSLHEDATFETEFASAWIGAAIERKNRRGALLWLFAQSQTRDNLELTTGISGSLSVRLTMAGWLRYEDIKRGRVQSRSVLMAMKFGDAELEGVVEKCFKPAVARAGFQLRPLNESQGAGLIDDQLRTALRLSRFIIADLTHGSHGSYWEAGFAEGLGRPVIYTCRRDQWDRGRSHFDTNHLVTIDWAVDDLARVAERLTAVIRATLPTEAHLTDE